MASADQASYVVSNYSCTLLQLYSCSDVRGVLLNGGWCWKGHEQETQRAQGIALLRAITSGGRLQVACMHRSQSVIRTHIGDRDPVQLSQQPTFGTVHDRNHHLCFPAPCCRTKLSRTSSQTLRLYSRSKGALGTGADEKSLQGPADMSESL